jgi:hypothetical protein
MRNMLALFAAGLLTVVGLGWYLDWYKVRSQPASVPGQHSVGIDINTTKIGTDLQKGEQKIQQMLENKVKDESKKLPAEVNRSAGHLLLPSPPSVPEWKIRGDEGPSQWETGGKKPNMP